jgi:hypothetical protein
VHPGSFRAAGEELAGFDQEGAPGRGQLDTVRCAVQQQHAQLAFQPLQLLAQRRLDGVFTAAARPKCSSSAGVTK